MAHLQPQGGGQVDPLGATVEHRLGAHVDRHPGDAAPAQHSPHLGRALEDEHVAALLLELVRRRQPADPGADDHDLPVLARLPVPPVLTHDLQPATRNRRRRRRVPPA